MRIWQDGREWVVENSENGNELLRFDSQTAAEQWVFAKGYEVVW